MTGTQSIKQKKRQHIIESAAKIFAEKGYAQTVMADIAAKAGIGKGTIYEYFNSKTDLFFAVFEWFCGTILQAEIIGILDSDQRAGEKINRLNERLVHELIGVQDLYTLSLEFWAASASSSMRDKFKASFKVLYRQYRAVVSTLIAEGMERGEFREDIDAEAVAAALVGCWDAMGLQIWFDESFEPIKTSRAFMDALLNGLYAKS